MQREGLEREGGSWNTGPFRERGNGVRVGNMFLGGMVARLIIALSIVHRWSDYKQAVNTTERCMSYHVIVGIIWWS